MIGALRAREYRTDMGLEVKHLGFKISEVPVPRLIKGNMELNYYSARFSNCFAESLVDSARFLGARAAGGVTTRVGWPIRACHS
jgi:hypothetical protein